MTDADHIKGQPPDAVAVEEAHGLERGGDTLSWDDAMRSCLEVVAQFRAAFDVDPFAFEPILIDGQATIVDLPARFDPHGHMQAPRVLH